MTEKLLQFIWQNKYFNTNHLQGVNGEHLHIKNVGLLNHNQGPDFLNASVTIDNIELHGNIELHVYSSDWEKHQHQYDKNYNNIILHVVWNNDKSNLENVVILELKNFVPKILLEHYNHLMQNQSQVACEPFLPVLNELNWLFWKERLTIERLQTKTILIENELIQNNHNWEETFWHLLAYNFGLKVNADFFKQIAESISITILAKNKNNLLSIEALLFGQANLLDEFFTENYPIQLKKEYQFLSKKYNLKRIEGSAFFLRMRPTNFPTIRLAQLAKLITQSSHLFSVIKETNSVKEIKQLFSVHACEYWNTHYRFKNDNSKDVVKRIGASTIDSLIINTFVPILYTYATFNGEEKYAKKAIEWLQSIKAEENKITNFWTLKKVTNESAFDSQALLHLTHQYCNKKKCLDCVVGNKILMNKI